VKTPRSTVPIESFTVKFVDGTTRTIHVLMEGAGHFRESVYVAANGIRLNEYECYITEKGGD